MTKNLKKANFMSERICFWCLEHLKLLSYSKTVSVWFYVLYFYICSYNKINMYPFCSWTYIWIPKYVELLKEFCKVDSYSCFYIFLCLVQSKKNTTVVKCQKLNKSSKKRLIEHKLIFWSMFPQIWIYIEKTTN